MIKSTTRERLLASSMIGGVAMLSLAGAPAHAQTTGAPAATEVQEVVVTGSRIRSPNLTSVSPVTVVNDQELKLEGNTNVENLLNNLPQVTASQSSGVANGATGIATVNLRGLGAVRTLVLVDGRRLMPGDPTTPVPDLNNIPSALVDRVDVLTGGASAVYGSDAIAGVVNFIMKRDFEGLRLDAQYGGYQHDNNNKHARGLLSGAPYPVSIPKGGITDGGTTDITLVMGANAPSGKGNITAYAGYRHLKPVLEGKRDYSACSVISTYSSDPTVYDTQLCAGSSNSAFGRFRGGSAPRTGLSLNPNGSRSFVPYTSAFQYNYGPLNYFQRPDDRYTAGFFAHYDLSKMVNLYADLMFSDDHTVAQVAPSGLFAGTGPNGTSTFAIRCDNPLMTATQQQQLCGTGLAGTSSIVQTTLGFRFASLPRQDDLRHTNYRITLGSKGDLGGGWSYDAYIQYGTSIYNEHFINDVSTSRVQNALLVNPATRQCLSGSADGCVPIDLFQLGALNQQMLNYVVAPGFKSGQTTEQIATFSVTGDLGGLGLKSPMADDAVGVAFGAEYRRESLDLRVDQEFASGDLSGQGGPTLGNSGSFDVYELFGEARLPLMQNQAFAKDLSVELGYRFSDYNTAANTTNAYKVGVNWMPVDDIKFRASYNRAARAPNVTELFTPAGVALFGGADPCAATNSGSVPATLAQCQRSGATAAQYAAGIAQCPAAQCTALLGGNPDLKVEKADTYTVGFVVRPRWIPRFDLSVDYYSIKVNNLISSLPNLIVVDCVLNGNAASCAKFHRDPATGTIFGNAGFVDARNVNTGYLKTQGIDINANYNAELSSWGLPDYGGLSFSFTGTYTQHYTVQPVTGASTFDCAGLYGPVCSALTNASSGPIPKWRHKFRTTWTTPWRVQLSLDWRHLSSASFDGNQKNLYLADPLGRKNIPDAKLRSVDYFDLSGTWKVRDTITFRAGVQNLFDKDPQVVDANNFPASGPPFGNGNTYPGTYDALGRTLFVGLTADF